MAYLLIHYETEFLLRAQELNLWLPTQLFWSGRMAYPGGLASWLGCYLTQFFFYPWLGTAILCTLWLVICLLLTYIYRLRGPWMLLSLLIPLALLACFTQTGYWLYYQKLQGHLFVPTVGVLFATLTLAASRLIGTLLPAKAAGWANIGWTIVVAGIGYPFFGAWALGAHGSHEQAVVGVVSGVAGRGPVARSRRAAALLPTPLRDDTTQLSLLRRVAILALRQRQL